MKPKRTADSALAKKLNRAVVIDCIEKYGALSRADIARLTMLSPSTVSSIVAELVDLGIVLESKGTAASSGGRRPILLDLNASASCAAVVDVQVSRVLYGVVDLAGKPIWTAKEEVDLSSPEATFHQVFQIVAKTLARLPEQARLQQESVFHPRHSRHEHRHCHQVNTAQMEGAAPCQPP